jgi:hypothetical protein
LDDEGLAADGELITGAWARDLADAHFEGRRLGVNAGLAEADDGVRPPGDDAHADRLPTRRLLVRMG